MATYGTVLHRGVELASRYRVLQEFDTMTRAIDSLSEASIRGLRHVWCDSKMGNFYNAEFIPGSKFEVYGQALAEALADVHQFYVYVTASDGKSSTELEAGDDQPTNVVPFPSGPRNGPRAA